MAITPNAPADFTPEMGNTSYTGYSGQGSFRFWCQKVLPLVYDDSLSYYETLCKVVAYLNNVISDISSLEGNFEELDTATKSNVDKLLAAYNELQGYVNDYFSTLNVQEEINKKLDEMAEDGTLSALIQPLFDEYKKEINKEVSGQNQKITVLETRMNTFASLPDGSTAGDAELADIRVGFNGKKYSSAGEAVREQITSAENGLASIGKSTGLYYFNKNILTHDGAIDTRTDEPYAASGWSYSDYIYIEGCGDIYCIMPVYADKTFCGISFYTAQQELVFSIDGETTGEIGYELVNIPFNEYSDVIKYFRISVRNSYADNFYFYGSKRFNYNCLPNIVKDITKNNYGYIRYDTGEVKTDSKTWFYTDYINCADICDMFITMPISWVIPNFYGLAFYDAEKHYISGVQVTTKIINKYREKINMYNYRTITIPENAVYFRTAFRIEDADNFFCYPIFNYYNKFNKLTAEIEKINYELYSHVNTPLTLFEKVGVIGDSITCGWSLDKNNVPSRRNTGISWPQQIGRWFGFKAYNLGASGVNPITWFDPTWEEGGDEGNQYCYKQYKVTEECDIYIISLGLNGGTLGSISDINQDNYELNANTFYGQYARIIQMINAEHPNSIIICLTEPRNKIPKYDAAIKEICSQDYIKAYVIDLYTNYGYLFNSSELTSLEQPDGIHYLPYGYTLIGKYTVLALNDFIKNNKNVFKYVGVKEV